MAQNRKTPSPHTREYTIGGLVKAMEGKDMNKPQPAYVFSNGVTKVDTDRTDSGIYKP